MKEKVIYFKTIKRQTFTHIAIISILLFLSPPANVRAQLVVSGSLTPQQLIDNILIGSGVIASNITYSGDAVSIGSFSGTSNIGFQSGILLTNGDIDQALGPNSTGSAGDNVNLPGDSDLTAISSLYSPTGNPIPTFDHCILEFDFIPLYSTIKFRYVFASEEYHEYSNSNVNDVFAFFISGPGITGPYSSPPGFPDGSVNVALIPGTTTGVSINTVNNGTTNSGPCLNCQYFVNNDQNTVQYDAWTTALTAWTFVSPGLLYHVKLAIADGGDHIFDSGVFLEENSFTSDSVIMDTVITKIDSVTATIGNIVYVPVYEYNFTDVRSFSHQIVYEDSILTFKGYTNVNPALDAGFVSDSVAGKCICSWSDQGSPVTLYNGELLYQIRFEYNGGNGILAWDFSSATNNLYTNLYGNDFPASWIDGCVNSAVSTEEISPDSEINIFPNPAINKVYISNPIIEARIYNQRGDKVLHVKTYTNCLDVSNLKKGLYIIEIITEESVSREKLILR